MILTFLSFVIGELKRSNLLRYELSMSGELIITAYFLKFRNQKGNLKYCLRTQLFFWISVI